MPTLPFTAGAKVKWNSKHYPSHMHVTNPTPPHPPKKKKKKESCAYKHDQIPSADTLGLLSSEIKQ